MATTATYAVLDADAVKEVQRQAPDAHTETVAAVRAHLRGYYIQGRN